MGLGIFGLEKFWVEELDVGAVGDFLVESIWHGIATTTKKKMAGGLTNHRVFGGIVGFGFLGFLGFLGLGYGCGHLAFSQIHGFIW